MFGPRCVRLYKYMGQLLTLTVASGSELSWRLGVSRDDATSANTDNFREPSMLRLRNVRVVVEGGAKLSVGMSMEETDIDDEEPEEDKGSSSLTTTTLALEGAAQQVHKNEILFYY